MNVADLRLIELSRTGDRLAFKELVERYRNQIQKLGYRMLLNTPDTEDIVQETFIRVYLNLKHYDETQKFSTWIYRICKNVCIDLLRKKKPIQSLDAKAYHEDSIHNHYFKIPAIEETPEQLALQSETREQIYQAIHKLPEKYKMIIQLYYLEDLSLQEISEKLQLPITTIKTRLHRGRSLLRNKWKTNFLLANIVILFQGTFY